MSVKIRLSRAGRKKVPFYHVVVADGRMPRDGRYIEALGFYNPNATSADGFYKLDNERISYWLSKGAQPSETLSKTFLSMGLGSERQRKEWTAKFARKKSIVEARVKAAAEAAAKAVAAEADAGKEASA